MTEITTEHRTTHPADTERRPSPMAVVRAAVAIVGIAAVAVGAFLDWVEGIAGDRLAFDAFWRAEPGAPETFLTSAAIGMLGVAVLGVIGLAFLGGWLLRFAGALGLVGGLLLFVQMGRADRAIADATDLGLWLCLAGAALLLIAGFIPATRVVRVPTDQVEDEHPHPEPLEPREHELPSQQGPEPEPEPRPAPPPEPDREPAPARRHHVHDRPGTDEPVRRTI